MFGLPRVSVLCMQHETGKTIFVRQAFLDREVLLNGLLPVVDAGDFNQSTHRVQTVPKVLPPPTGTPRQMPSP